MSIETYSQMAEVLAHEGIDVNLISSYLGMPLETTIIIVAIIFSFIMIWSLVWKGLALWESVKKNHKIWFILLLILNTVGILEILYIYVFSKMEVFNKTKESKTKSKDFKKRKK